MRNALKRSTGRPVKAIPKRARLPEPAQETRAEPEAQAEDQGAIENLRCKAEALCDLANNVDQRLGDLAARLLGAGRDEPEPAHGAPAGGVAAVDVALERLSDVLESVLGHVNALERL